MKKDMEIANVNKKAIKRMFIVDMFPYPGKGGKMRHSGVNAHEATSGNAQEEDKQANPGNPKTSCRKITAMDNYREIFLQQPVKGGCRQTTLNIEGKNHSAIKKVLKAADGLSMAGFVNNVLTHHFREHGQEITGIMCSYMSDLYKEEE